MADCSELARTITELALAIGTQPGKGNIDAIVAEMQTRLPEITREMVVDSIVEATAGQSRTIDEARKQAAAIKREARQDRELRQTIQKIEQHLESGTLPETQQRPPSPASDEVKRLRGLRDELRKQLGRSEPAMQKRLEKSIRDLESKLDSIIDGSYIAPVKPTPAQTATIERLTFERDRLRRTINQRINALKPRTVFERVSEPFNAARAILTSFDFSGLLRQGGFVVVGHPVRSARAIPKMFKAFASERAQQRIWDEIQSRPNAPLYARSKLYLAPPDSSQGLTKQEEAYMSRWAEKVPLVAASQRAYTTALNVLRADSFDAMVQTLAKNADATQAEADAIANYVNVATGRGTLGKAEGFAMQLNTIFFAPKYVASRFQLLAGQPLYHGTGRTRALVAKEYARYLIGMGLVYALAQAMWGDEEDFSIEFDPRSSNFGRLRFGDARLDPLSGLAQTATLVSRIGTGKTKTQSGELVSIRADAPFGRDTAGEVGWRFLRSKFSPMIGTAVDLAEGQNVVGEPVTLGSAATNLVTPLALREVYEAIEDQGATRGTAMALAVIFGVGLSVYGKDQQDTSAARRNLPPRPRPRRPTRPQVGRN